MEMTGNGYGNGNGNGSGYGNGSGSGYGNGSGYGYGNGNGSERPIIFNGAMSLAVIEGRKTMTRRPFPLKHQAHSGGVAYDQWSGIAELVADGSVKRFKMPCVVGDKLWVRECWRAVWSGFEYRCDGARYPRMLTASQVAKWGHWQEKLAGGKWAPSIHMPRWASRTVLDVLDVRVERLQDITDEGARAEGFASRVAFIETWDAIYPSMPFHADPWVWRIEFKGAGSLQ